jgi:hypothetical protein
MKPAPPKPCSDCPWWRGKAGRHPLGLDYEERRTALWDHLREGRGVMTCHKTDPRLTERYPAAGVRADRVPHECAGSLVLVQRELALFRAEHDSDPASYCEARPHGLTRRGIAVWLALHGDAGLAQLPPADGVKRPPLDLEVDVGHKPLED